MLRVVGSGSVMGYQINDQKQGKSVLNSNIQVKFYKKQQSHEYIRKVRKRKT